MTAQTSTEPGFVAGSPRGAGFPGRGLAPLPNLVGVRWAIESAPVAVLATAVPLP